MVADAFGAQQEHAISASGNRIALSARSSIHLLTNVESSRKSVVTPLSPGLETTNREDLIETGEVQIIRYSQDPDHHGAHLAQFCS